MRTKRFRGRAALNQQLINCGERAKLMSTDCNNIVTNVILSHFRYAVCFTVQPLLEPSFVIANFLGSSKTANFSESEESSEEDEEESSEMSEESEDKEESEEKSEVSDARFNDTSHFSINLKYYLLLFKGRVVE